jgi:hypothetical protein
MNELVKKLSAGKHKVIVNRPDKTAAGLQERLDLAYLHVLFTDTGTEIGVRLDKTKCKLPINFVVDGKGLAHVEGILTLNYEKVRCIVDFNIENMEGTGYLESIDNNSYELLLKESLVK